jgi:hypothetical protein
VLRLASLLTIGVFVFPVPAFGADSSTGGSATSTQPIVDVTGNTALIFVGAVVLVLALLWYSILFYDTRRADEWRSVHQVDILKHLIDRLPTAASGETVSVEDLRQIVAGMNRQPRGGSGLTQSLIALSVVSLVSVALVATLVSAAVDSGDLRKTIITSLISILATVAGFYFGARTAQTAAEAATQPPAASRPNRPPNGGAPSSREGDQERGARTEPSEHKPPPRRRSGASDEPHDDK